MDARFTDLATLNEPATLANADVRGLRQQRLGGSASGGVRGETQPLSRKQ
jgi:hypothetical protein